MNSSKEITTVLREILEDAGYSTCTMFTYEFKEDHAFFDEFIKSNQPNVIVYDIALPYTENYNLFKKLYARPLVKKIPFVLTTTNKSALESLVGKTKTHELVGKPYDLEEILQSIKEAYAKNKES